MIEIKGLSKVFGENKIFENVNYVFENNNIYALVGVNGIGKTTFLNCITQSKFKDTGKIIIDNIPVEGFKSKYNIFYVPDKEDMFLNLTGVEYLSFISKIYKRDTELTSLKIEELSRELKIANDLNKYIKDYSLGMKKKVYIIGALISGAKNIIFDESFAGLDPEMIYLVKKLLLNYKSENSLVIYSIHNLDMVSNFCDYVVLIDKNHQVFSTKNNKNLSELDEMFFYNCIKKE